MTARAMRLAWRRLLHLETRYDRRIAFATLLAAAWIAAAVVMRIA